MPSWKKIIWSGGSGSSPFHDLCEDKFWESPIIWHGLDECRIVVMITTDMGTSVFDMSRSIFGLIDT